MSKLPLPDLGAYLREQRESAQLSLRQLAEMAGVSNPYLSQIERGLKRPERRDPAADRQGLAGLGRVALRPGRHPRRAGHRRDPAAAPDVLSAIAADPVLTDRQRAVLVDIYLSFVGTDETAAATTPRTPRAQRSTHTPAGAPRRRPSRSTTAAATPELNEKEN